MKTFISHRIMKISQRQKFLIYTFLTWAIACALYRVFPYFSSMIPLGYDPGVYRGIYMAYLHLAPRFHFGQTVPYWIMHEPLRGILSVVAAKIWISIDIFLTFWLWFFSILGWFLIFLNTRKYSKRAALFAMMFFRTSIIQYQAFALCYYKQIIGIDLILLLLYLRDHKKYRTSIPLLICLVLLHRTTTIFLGATSFLYILLQFITTKKINSKFILIWMISGIVWISLYGPLFPRLITDFFQPLVTTIWGAGIQGDFFSVKEFRRFTMFLIIPTLYGLYLKIKNKDYDLLFSGLVIGICWTSFGLLNAKRSELFLDVFMILMTWYAIYFIIKQKKRRLRSLLYLGVFLQMMYYLWYVSRNNTPLITPGELTSITTLQDIIPTSGIVVGTDSYLSPWIVGYANRDRITPWLSDMNKRTHTQRNQRWPANGKIKCDMFQIYQNLHRPLYMRESKVFRIENISGGTCFKLVREDNYHKLYQIMLP